MLRRKGDVSPPLQDLAAVRKPRGRQHDASPTGYSPHPDNTLPLMAVLLSIHPTPYQRAQGIQHRVHHRSCTEHHTEGTAGLAAEGVAGCPLLLCSEARRRRWPCSSPHRTTRKNSGSTLWAFRRAPKKPVAHLELNLRSYQPWLFPGKQVSWARASPMPEQNHRLTHI